MTKGPSSANSEPQATARSRKSRFWAFFRLVLGIGGATLVVFPVASGNSYILSIAGLTMFIAAILLLPARPRISLSDKAREFGALFIVDGGRYRPPNSSSAVPVQLFVAADLISARDSKFRVLLEIRNAEITSFIALEDQKGWFLELIWTTGAAEFSYRGASAERLAHIAENAIRRVATAPGPLIPQRRAAGA